MIFRGGWIYHTCPVQVLISSFFPVLHIECAHTQKVIKTSGDISPLPCEYSHYLMPHWPPQFSTVNLKSQAS